MPVDEMAANLDRPEGWDLYTFAALVALWLRIFRQGRGVVENRCVLACAYGCGDTVTIGLLTTHQGHTDGKKESSSSKETENGPRLYGFVKSCKHPRSGRE